MTFNKGGVIDLHEFVPHEPALECLATGYKNTKATRDATTSSEMVQALNDKVLTDASSNNVLRYKKGDVSWAWRKRKNAMMILTTNTSNKDAKVKACYMIYCRHILQKMVNAPTTPTSAATEGPTTFI
jgi:hypothetical protein